MTGSQLKLEDAVENLWFKGIARGAMIVLFPFVLWFANREIAIIDSLIIRVGKMEISEQVGEQSAMNDRANVHSLTGELQKRIDLIFERMNTLPTRSDIEKDLLWRDQRIDNLDRRIGAVEDRMRNQNQH